VLAEMIDSGAANAAFFPEEDRLRLALLRARNQTIDERPGLIGETPEDRAALNQPPSDAELAAEAEAARERESRSLRDTIVEFPNPNENANNDGDGND
jgi:hypothetical protein